MMLLTPAYQSVLWLMAHHYRAHRALRAVLWLSVSLVVAVAAAASLAYLTPAKRPLAAGVKLFAVCITLMSIGEWRAVLSAALALQAPPAAALIPGLRRHLAGVLAATWLLFTVGIGLFISLALEIDPLAGMAALGIVLSAETARRVLPLWFWAGLLAGVIVLRTNITSAFEFGKRVGLYFNQGAGAAAAMAAALLLGLLVLFAIARRPRATLAERLRALFKRGRRSGTTWRAEMLNEWFGRKLFALGMRRAARSREPMALLGYGLGPRAHWSMMALPLAIFALLSVWTSASPVSQSKELSEGIITLVVALSAGVNVALMSFMVGSASLAGYRTRAEQALIGLAPGVPAAGRQQALAKVQVRNILIAWLGLLIVQCVDVARPSPVALNIKVAAIIVSLLLLVPLAVRRHTPADTEADHTLGMWAPVGLLAVIGLVHVIDSSLRLGGWAWSILFASPVICFIEVRRRLRAMGAIPAAAAHRSLA